MEESAKLRRFSVVSALCLMLSAFLSSCGSNPAPPAAATHPRIPTGVVDTPQPNETVKNKFIASGWAIADDGIKRVSVYVDLAYLTDCNYGISRPDVAQAMKTSNDKAGWNVELNLSPGKHEVVIEAESLKGAVRDLGIIPITVTP